MQRVLNYRATGKEKPPKPTCWEKNPKEVEGKRKPLNDGSKMVKEGKDVQNGEESWANAKRNARPSLILQSPKTRLCTAPDATSPP